MPSLPSRNTWSDFDAFCMRRAVELSVLGRPSPNPCVGAIIAKNGKILGEGYHARAGQAHAEVAAIRDVRKKHGSRADALLRGSTLYVTLEPCAHHGLTPPCTDAILAHKMKEVVFSMHDPNKSVRGGGAKLLARAGVRVRSGLFCDSACAINAAFISRCERKRPFLTLKMAMSLDGKSATRLGDSKWISSEKSRELAHLMRAKCGAILVGAGTVVKDDPHLTARVDPARSEKRGRIAESPSPAGAAGAGLGLSFSPIGLVADPLRVIVDGGLKIPLKSKALRDGNVLVATLATKDKFRLAKLQKIRAAGVGVIVCPAVSRDNMDLRHVLAHLHNLGINHVLCEGGPELAARLLKQGLVDEMLLFVAPKIIGGRAAPGPIGGEGARRMQDAVPGELAAVYPVGGDVLLCAHVSPFALKFPKRILGPVWPRYP